MCWCGAHSKSNILVHVYSAYNGLKNKFPFFEYCKNQDTVCFVNKDSAHFFYATITQPSEARKKQFINEFLKEKGSSYYRIYTWSANDLLASVHLTLSPESPSMSIVALVIFLRHESASSSSSYQQITLIKSCSTNLTHNTKLIVYVSILQAAVWLATIEFNLVLSILKWRRIATNKSFLLTMQWI